MCYTSRIVHLRVRVRSCICNSQVWFNIIFILWTGSTLWCEHSPHYGLRTVTVLEDRHCVWGQLKTIHTMNGVITVCPKYMKYINLIRIIFEIKLNTLDIYLRSISRIYVTWFWKFWSYFWNLLKLSTFQWPFMCANLQ